VVYGRELIEAAYPIETGKWRKTARIRVYYLLRGNYFRKSSFSPNKFGLDQSFPYISILLDEIDAGTVDFKENYDGTLEEPVCLPAQLPHVLLNPVSGIVVGMATEIPPHNLEEVAQAVCDDQKALDFPG